MILVSTTSGHVAPPKVTIASRPKTAAAIGGGVTTHVTGINSGVPVSAIAQQQLYENARKNSPSKKPFTPVPASTHATTSLFAAHESSFRGAKATPLGTASPSSSAADTTGNIYHAMAARKSAEDTATQLARRIAHFRAQEERVLREVQEVKSRLETALFVAHESPSDHQEQQQEGTLWPAIGSPKHRPLQGWAEKTGGGFTSNTQSQREPKAPRSREQLQFLAKQKKVLQTRKLESAKHQKEKRKLALEKQKLKEEADKHSKVAQKEKIRQEYQRALHERVTKQHQLLESLEGQHEERLQIEKEREHRALSLIEQLREEEKHVALRLQALKFHQEFIKRGGLSDSE
ncbi:hypothetical protein Gpo141_00005710 [Globisporangium polare]